MTRRTPRVTVAATQLAISTNLHENIAKGEKYIREAASQGAQIILLQELFGGPYFCQELQQAYFSWARTVENSEIVQHFRKVAAELSVVLPVSFFERANNAYYNSIAIIDADGSVLGVYRKSHIPDSPGYMEKFYFTPGDTGFKVWNTMYARVGVAICWDQWFPEGARAMALMGADILFYPTAIGSEPQDTTIDSKGWWRRVMQGHAGANMVPLVASNRISFYGASFITDETGAIVAEADDRAETVVTATFDLDKIASAKTAWGLFRDRRPDLYRVLLTKDGKHVAPGL